MTTIILTVIGILLAAASALMLLFYGGDSLNAGSVNAQADTFVNGGVNIVMGSQMAKANEYVWNNMAGLKAGGYIESEPALPNALTGVLTNTEYTVSAVPGNVCIRINVNLSNGINSGTGSVADPFVAPATLPAGKKMGCANNTFTARL